MWKSAIRQVWKPALQQGIALPQNLRKLRKLLFMVVRMYTDKHSAVAVVAKQKRVIGESVCGVDHQEDSLHPCSSVVNIISVCSSDSRRAPKNLCQTICLKTTPVTISNTPGRKFC